MSIVLPLVLVSLLVIASIALFQAYQGLFSSFVMLVLTAISVAVAMNYCEPLGWSLGKWHPNHLMFVLLFGGLITIAALARIIMQLNRFVRLAVGAVAVVFLAVVGSQCKLPTDAATGNPYGQAMAFVGLFAITLLCLRAIVDNVVLGNMVFAWQIERAGGAVFGFLTGMIVIGVALIGWQMMPFGPGLFGGGYQDFYGLTPTSQKKPADEAESKWRTMPRHNRINLEVSPPAMASWASYNRYNEKMELQAAPFPYADGFVLAMIKALGNGSIAAQERDFAQIHPDLLLELWAGRNGINFLSRQAAPGHAIRSAKWQIIDKDASGSEPQTIQAALTLTFAYEARDEDGSLRFKGTQVRLVSQSGQSYWPRGVYLQGMPLSKLMGGLATDGYMSYKSDYYLWAKTEQIGSHQRREIRGQTGQLWWQLQMAGASGELEILPASFGLVRKLGRNESPTIELLFQVPAEEKPDYVVFKRTAMQKVTIIRDEPQPSPEESPPEPSVTP